MDRERMDSEEEAYYPYDRNLQNEEEMKTNLDVKEKEIKNRIHP